MSLWQGCLEIILSLAVVKFAIHTVQFAVWNWRRQVAVYCVYTHAVRWKYFRAPSGPQLLQAFTSGFVPSALDSAACHILILYDAFTHTWCQYSVQWWMMDSWIWSLFLVFSMQYLHSVYLISFNFQCFLIVLSLSPYVLCSVHPALKAHAPYSAIHSNSIKRMLQCQGW